MLHLGLVLFWVSSQVLQVRISLDLDLFPGSNLFWVWLNGFGLLTFYGRNGLGQVCIQFDQVGFLGSGQNIWRET